MTTPNPDPINYVADFLLARYAEETERTPIPTGARRNGKATARRVHADLEAKRRIVARCRGRIEVGELWTASDPDGRFEPARNEGAWELIHDDAWATLYDLAAPYADHPDFNPAWTNE